MSIRKLVAVATLTAALSLSVALSASPPDRGLAAPALPTCNLPKSNADALVILENDLYRTELGMRCVLLHFWFSLHYLILFQHLGDGHHPL